MSSADEGAGKPMKANDAMQDICCCAVGVMTRMGVLLLGRSAAYFLSWLLESISTPDFRTDEILIISPYFLCFVIIITTIIMTKDNLLIFGMFENSSYKQLWYGTADIPYELSRQETPVAGNVTQIPGYLLQVPFVKSRGSCARSPWQDLCKNCCARFLYKDICIECPVQESLCRSRSPRFFEEESNSMRQ